VLEGGGGDGGGGDGGGENEMHEVEPLDEVCPLGQVEQPEPLPSVSLPDELYVFAGQFCNVTHVSATVCKEPPELLMHEQEEDEPPEPDEKLELVPAYDPPS